jgi:cytolysin-activating lysine-acyltransferase
VFGSKKKQSAAPTLQPSKATASGMQPTGSPADHGAPDSRFAGAGHNQANAGAEPLTLDEAQRRAAIRQSLAFAQIISVLMCSPHYQHYTLGDLEWLVLPPLLTGQFSVAEARLNEGGPRFPAAVALWASVSADVDKRLSENQTVPIRLRPDEWKSGDILWLVDAIGDGRVVPALLKQLGEGAWRGRDVKTRVRKKSGQTNN